MKRLLIPLAVVVAITPNMALATGMYSCSETDRSEWLSKDALLEKVEALGWSVRRMKEDGGCWEVYGTMPDGKRVEAYFHPVTGDIKLINQRGKILFRATD